MLHGHCLICVATRTHHHLLSQFVRWVRSSVLCIPVAINKFSLSLPDITCTCWVGSVSRPSSSSGYLLGTFISSGGKGQADPGKEHNILLKSYGLSHKMWINNSVMVYIDDLSYQSVNLIININIPTSKWGKDDVRGDPCGYWWSDDAPLLWLLVAFFHFPDL